GKGSAARGMRNQSESMKVSKSLVADDAAVQCHGQAALANRPALHYLVLKKEPAMTDATSRILDDLAKLMTDAAGAAQGVRREVETAFRAQAERILGSMDVVQREEFEAIREMALKARNENDALAARLDSLEKRLAALEIEGKDPLPKV